MFRSLATKQKISGYIWSFKAVGIPKCKYLFNLSQIGYIAKKSIKVLLDGQKWHLFERYYQHLTIGYDGTLLGGVFGYEERRYS